ncbi:SMC-Scp complex subunit ScpB [Rhodovibrio salinarum]|uniref:SMC-Scp complex subunit ScpB n=1 Tax=Rhodovibrio salinarum TaxID=1087 RepID=A0A934QJR8_9PROT|nr:SMC-Scp complex subunit ScpB [Rhodovibrio salinarum]MBK1697740.1 SMC-Scp complex subunit ScpB [Rhodovibrio salinarum]
MTESQFERLRLLEAVLFAAADPKTPGEFARYLPEDADIDALLGELQQLYTNRGIELRRIGNAYAFRTAEDLAGQLRIDREVTRKLSRAAVETLAIVAYHQPVTRGEIEEIRGVSLNKGTLDTLLEAEFIRPRGRRQTPGRPVTWCTTQNFLDHFGLSEIKDLPGLEELKASGLIDQRPAMASLSARGLLGEAAEQEGDDDQAGDDEDSEEALDPAFGEDLLDDGEGADTQESDDSAPPR